MKYSTSRRPTGRSFSSPIQRSGHSERSRQSRQYGNSAGGVDGGELRFVFIFVSTQSIHAPSQNSEPVPSHPGICLRTSQFRRGRASRSHLGTTTKTVSSDLFWLSSTSVRLRPVSHAAAVRVHRLLGLSGFSGLLHATGQLQRMRGVGRRSAVGYGEAHLDQGSHVFPGALGAQTFLEGNCRRVSDFLG